MSVKDIINSRQSIRKYKNKPVPEEVIMEILEAARQAPSAKNIQSHRYMIVKDKETKKKLKKFKVFKQLYVYEAPLIIVCCADPSQYPQRVKVDETHDDYARIDLSIAASFLVLRATELGLGSVFVAWIHRDKIKEVLNIPKNFIVPFVIPIGYPAEDPKPRERKKLDDIIL